MDGCMAPNGTVRTHCSRWLPWGTVGVDAISIRHCMLEGLCYFCLMCRGQGALREGACREPKGAAQAGEEGQEEGQRGQSQCQGKQCKLLLTTLVVVK